MQQTLSHVVHEFSLLARIVSPAVWIVTQASRLSRRTGILACWWIDQVWKPARHFRLEAEVICCVCWIHLWLKRAGVSNSMK